MSEEQNAVDVVMDEETYAAIRKSREQFNSIPAPVDSEPEPEAEPLLDRPTYDAIEKSRSFVDSLSWGLTPDEEAKVFGSAAVANRINDPSEDGMSVAQAVSIIQLKRNPIWAEIAGIIAGLGGEFAAQAELITNTNSNAFQRALGIKEVGKRIARYFDTAFERLMNCTSEEKRQIPEDIVTLLRSSSEVSTPQV